MVTLYSRTKWPAFQQSYKMLAFVLGAFVRWIYYLWWNFSICPAMALLFIDMKLCRIYHGNVLQDVSRRQSGGAQTTYLMSMPTNIPSYPGSILTSHTSVTRAKVWGKNLRGALPSLREHVQFVRLLLDAFIESLFDLVHSMKKNNINANVFMDRQNRNSLVRRPLITMQIYVSYDISDDILHKYFKSHTIHRTPCLFMTR